MAASTRSEFQLTDSTAVTNSHNDGGNLLDRVEPGAALVGRVSHRCLVVHARQPEPECQWWPGCLSSIFTRSAIHPGKQVTLQYSLTPVRYVYNDTTVFGVLSENGSSSVTARRGHHPGRGAPSMDRFRASTTWTTESASVNVFGGVNLRIFRGLSFNVFGEFNRIKDQIYLPKTDFTDQDILLQQVQLGTDYSYFVNFGLSYRFGSKVNNVVNPRFGGGGFFFFSN